MEIDRQEKARAFVQNHVYLNQSMLIEKLLADGVFQYEDITNGMFYPCPECGGNMDEIVGEENIWQCDNCEHKQEDEPEQELQEIFEWWACSDYLIRMAKEHGEPVLETDYGDWWGRTCTGQAILLDSWIDKLAND